MNTREAETAMMKRVSERREHGFGILEVIITVAIISIVSTFAVLGIARARNSIRLQTSARQFAGYVEKARIDSIRRHTVPSSARVEFISNNTYAVTMDFNGTGTPTTRNFTLELGVEISAADGSAIPVSDLPYVDFDWRGRTTECLMTFRMQNSNGAASTVSVAGSGDVTINSTVGATLPNVPYTAVSNTNGVASGATILGNDAAPIVEPCGSSSSTSTTIPSSPPTAACGGITPNVASITIKKNGGNTGSFVITVTTAETITAWQSDGRSNLQFLPSAAQSAAANTSKTFTVKSLNSTRGTFPVRFSTSCASITVYVKVVN
ncbi:MAG: prepilin-type N-terminal cleavage/methylation domain-containing protein [Pyrinomonadaceae bacterium]|nr:prepilin-type N-terminal cleavage/methylation domain-containing protein [Pyrinomonadaceae bacterium]